MMHVFYYSYEFLYFFFFLFRFWEKGNKKKKSITTRKPKKQITKVGLCYS